MLEANKFSEFFSAIADDPRINTTHITLYMGLLQYWKEHSFLSPMYVFSHDIMQIAKISSGVTYFKSIKDLNDFGYIQYEPSYSPKHGSKIYIR